MGHEFVLILRNHGVEELLGLKMLLEVEVELLRLLVLMLLLERHGVLILRSELDIR